METLYRVQEVGLEDQVLWTKYYTTKENYIKYKEKAITRLKHYSAPGFKITGSKTKVNWK